MNNTIISLPITSSKKIDFDFIEEFIAELEERSVAEFEAWLRAAGFENYNLTEEKQTAIKEIDKQEYKMFNVEDLFGKSTRGKRLKSADRVTGSLPFVTAGETDEGISAFIGNCVTIFPANTTTIDMFGSAKYRNYEYGADDHIAVVHTQKLQEDAAIFVTSAIHKWSHNGQFDYGKNFYAKDADELNILLPTKGVVPDYSKMAIIISAVKKLVIKDIAVYANKKIRVAQQVIAKWIIAITLKMFSNQYYSNWENIFAPHKCKLLIITIKHIWGSEVVKWEFMVIAAVSNRQLRLFLY